MYSWTTDGVNFNDAPFSSYIYIQRDKDERLLAFCRQIRIAKGAPSERFESSHNVNTGTRQKYSPVSSVQSVTVVESSVCDAAAARPIDREYLLQTHVSRGTERSPLNDSQFEMWFRLLCLEMAVNRDFLHNWFDWTGAPALLLANYLISYAHQPHPHNFLHACNRSASAAIFWLLSLMSG